MITVTEEATRALRLVCAATGREPSVRVRTVGAGQPLPVEVEADSDHRPGDVAIAAEGVVVLVDRALAAAVGDRSLDAVSPDDGSAPRFVLASRAD
ncbi:hypothetical protein [Actinomycetospora sp. TBRC 11914]|uniref:hypothetical protein n=1 Tax=Actinomycetospora sp. TBRC 11914 TaxID=2729387 RepID=UPI00145E66CB|nr:hypothetical protein [Actinomycetospora sp. TBRC 11914]NMO93242.1 hypothetical protein [Actinomycetospora sp. TBRC 11914]